MEAKTIGNNIFINLCIGVFLTGFSVFQIYGFGAKNPTIPDCYSNAKSFFPVNVTDLSQLDKKNGKVTNVSSYWQYMD